MFDNVSDDPRLIHETLCVAQFSVLNANIDPTRKTEHVDRLQRLIDEFNIEEARPGD